MENWGLKNSQMPSTVNARDSEGNRVRIPRRNLASLGVKSKILISVKQD